MESMIELLKIDIRGARMGDPSSAPAASPLSEDLDARRSHLHKLALAQPPSTALTV